MQHPDEGTIHAWLDGELGADEVQALESHIATCPECSAKVAEARGLVAASSRIVSALDVIPGDVIPASTKTINRRPWYSTMQFRAAASLLVVAGASLLLLNRGQEKAARAILTEAREQTPAAASAPAASDAASEIPPVVPATKPVQVQKKIATAAPPSRRVFPKTLPAPVETGQSQRLSRAPEKVVDAPANVTAPRTVDAVSGFAMAAPGREQRDEAAPDLKLVRSDTSQVAVKNVYEVRKGVEVTLTETTLPSQRLRASAAGKQNLPTIEHVVVTGVPAAVPAPAPAAPSAQQATNVITWVKGDKTFTLMGAMSREELEALRLRLPQDKR